MDLSIRWKQRFSNYIKALDKLSEAVNYIKNTQSETASGSNYKETLDEMIKEGLIQRFEYTHELAWNVMKDYAIYQGNNAVGGSRDAVREAFQLKLIENAKLWMDMILSRNKTSHTYNEETANEIYQDILELYYSAFLKFEQTMEEKRSGEQTTFI